MKNFLLFCAIIALFSFNLITNQSNGNATAEVNRVQGVYIFVDSKPLKPYEFLGTVKLTKKELRKRTDSGQYQDVRDDLLNKLKQVHPKADGAIFNFHDMGEDMCDAIKFKD